MYKFNGVPPLRLVFLMWLFFSIESYFHVDLGFLGILPRTVNGLIGFFAAPLIHGNITHLVSNTFPLLFLGSSLYFFYPKHANQVFLQCYFFTNFLVWLFGRSFFHIGASGLIYGLAFFLISSGIFKRDFRSLTISVIVVLVYGGLFYGILPTNSNISWESHLFGAIVGIGSSLGLFYQSKN